MADNISISDTDNTIDNIEISMSDDETTETIILADGTDIDAERMSLVDTDYTSITNRLTSLEDTVETLSPFIFEQSVPSDTWVVEHNLGRIPSITLVDQFGRVFEAEREYPTGYETTKVIIHLNGATRGKVLLN